MESPRHSCTRHDESTMLEFVEIPEPATVRTADDRIVGYYAFGDPQGTPVVALHGTPACGAGYAWADERARARDPAARARPSRCRRIRALAPGSSTDRRRLRARVGRVRRRTRTRDLLARGLLRRGSVCATRRTRPCRSCARGRDRVGFGSRRCVGVDRRLRDERPRADATRRAHTHARAGVGRVLRVRRPFGAEVVDSLRAGGDVGRGPRGDGQVSLRPRRARGLQPVVSARARGVVDDYAILGRPWGFSVEDIAVPIHCWHATADKVVPIRHTEELGSRIPGARLISWVDEGHLAIVDRVGEVFDTLLPPPRPRLIFEAVFRSAAEDGMMMGACCRLSSRRRGRRCGPRRAGRGLLRVRRPRKARPSLAARHTRMRRGASCWPMRPRARTGPPAALRLTRPGVGDSDPVRTRPGRRGSTTTSAPTVRGLRRYRAAIGLSGVLGARLLRSAEP